MRTTNALSVPGSSERLPEFCIAPKNTFSPKRFGVGRIPLCYAIRKLRCTCSSSLDAGLLARFKKRECIAVQPDSMCVRQTLAALSLLVLFFKQGEAGPNPATLTVSDPTYSTNGQLVNFSWSGIPGVQESDVVALVHTSPKASDIGSRCEACSAYS
jgi:hypothetical protein